MKKIGVVILNYKLEALTIKCLKSVLNSSYKNLNIIVVDNNSGDLIESRVKKFSNVAFIQSGDNLGYAGGNNVGIKRALEMGNEYVLLLNPDTEVEKSAIERLLLGVEKYNAGIASPKIYMGHSNNLWFAGKVFDINNVLGLHRGINEKDVGQFDSACEIEDATGAALFVKREVFERIGYLDERYFLYYEDSDFCFRARRDGFKIMYIPESIVYHDASQSTKLGSPLQDYFITRNRMLFANRFLSLRTQFALLREALWHIGNPARRMALVDFLLGKYWKGSFIK